MEKADARRALGISTKAPVILILDPGPGGERKGTHLLKEFSERVTRDAGEKPHYLLFGRGAEAWKGANVTAVGEVDIPKLPTVYSAADLFVFPTLADNLPNVAVESMSLRDAGAVVSGRRNAGHRFSGTDPERSSRPRPPKPSPPARS